MKTDPRSSGTNPPSQGNSQERFGHLTFDLDLDENGRSRRHPFVPPEAFETPMTDEEFKGFIAGLEEAKKRIEAVRSPK